jgi:trk system potassium uptake protein TrkA
MRILIVDGHAEADYLIGSLIEKRHKVVVINADRGYSRYLASAHDIAIINGDASKQYVLDEAKIRDFDLVVALSEDDATNLVICQTAKRLYGIKKAVAVVKNPHSVEIFKELGVNTAISSAHLVATSIEQASNIETLSHSLSLANGSVTVSEITIERSFPACGKVIMDIGFADDFNISCIVRKSETLIPRGSTEIRAGDVLIIVTKAERTKHVLAALTGSIGNEDNA